MHNLFLVYFVNLCMFQAYLGPLSGGTTFNPTRTTDSHLKRISTKCCIHTVHQVGFSLHEYILCLCTICHNLLPSITWSTIVKKRTAQMIGMTSFKCAHFIVFNFMDNGVQQHSDQVEYFGSVYLQTVILYCLKFDHISMKTAAL